MRVFAISDIHVDYEENWNWFNKLSMMDYKKDILIMAGDITHDMSLLQKSFISAASRFNKVMYVPGNHDLWVNWDRGINSLEKCEMVMDLSDKCGIIRNPLHIGDLSLVPLMAWYDYSFGYPSESVCKMWMDYIACKWPEGFDQRNITSHFLSMNKNFLKINNKIIISFSHFMPRIDIMPSFIPPDKRLLYPVLGTLLLEKQIRELGPDIHVYGHSHVNVETRIDNTLYLNNAFGYPHESFITRKKLICIYDEEFIKYRSENFKRVLR